MSVEEMNWSDLGDSLKNLGKKKAKDESTVSRVCQTRLSRKLIPSQRQRTRKKQRAKDHEEKTNVIETKRVRQGHTQIGRKLTGPGERGSGLRKDPIGRRRKTDANRNRGRKEWKKNTNDFQKSSTNHFHCKRKLGPDLMIEGRGLASPT